MTSVATSVTSVTGRLATRYAELGWPVFPVYNPVFRGKKTFCSCPLGERCDRPGKHPNSSLPGAEHGLHGATCDKDIVSNWWNTSPGSSVAIRMGRKSIVDGEYEGCGYILLDIDNGYNEKGVLRQGDYELDILEDAVGKLPDTWETRSGHGRHLWFKHPGGDLFLSNKGNIQIPKPDNWGDEVAFLDKTRKKIVLPSLQIRGDGGYVVAPPSRHYSGNSYSWVVSKADIPDAADIPEGLLRILARKIGSAPTDDFVPEGTWPDISMRIKRAKAYLSKIDPAISGNGGHGATFRAALWVVRGFVLSVRDAYSLLSDHYNPRCSPPWPEEELARKCEEVATKSHHRWGFAYDGDEAREMEREMARLSSPGVVTWVENDARADIVSSAALRLVEEDEGSGDPPGPPNPPTHGGGQGDDGGAGLHYDFITGSEAELALAMRRHLERDGRVLTYSESFFWIYDPRRGIWSRLNDLWIQGQLRRFDQCPVGENGNLKVSNSMTIGATKILANTYAPQGGDMSIPSGIEAYHFSKTDTGIAFRNGFMRITVQKDLRDLEIELVPHSPRNMARLFMDMDWTDKAQPSPVMDRFFENLFHDVDEDQERKDRIALLQEFVGAALAGICTSLQGYLLLRGDGNNGKSELIKLIESLFDESSIASIPVDAFDKNFRLRALVGARVNIADDLASGKLSASASAHLRRLVTGNRIDLDVKYRDPTSFVPIAGHIYSANDLFEPSDSTEGQWRRCLVLPMTADFGKRKDLRRPNAALEVIQNERAQVVQWAIRGLIRLIREQHGVYTMPMGSKEAKQEWRESSDPVYDFLCNAGTAVRFALNSKGGILSSDLYAKYVESYESVPASLRRGYEMSNKVFSMKAKSTSLVSSKRKTEGVVFMAGQALVDIWDRKDTMSDREIKKSAKDFESRPEEKAVLTSNPPGKEEDP